MPPMKTLAVERGRPLSIVIIGASGDLARRHILPALFALYCQNLLPERFQIVGYARSEMDDAQFRERIMEHLTCRYVPGEHCDDWMSRFLERCTYCSGAYDSPEQFRRLQQKFEELGADSCENRLFYMAIPPFLFLESARALAEAGLVNPESEDAWARVVIEKPFGSDRASSDALTKGMAEVFTEEQTYRIDHYLGKEVIQNLMVLRFANLIFDPIWNRLHINSVRISWMEDLGLEGRAGYFDSYGIIRDVMQNHLLQMLALVAMEAPLSLDSQHVRDEKVKALRAVPPLHLNDLVIGQYTAGVHKGSQYFGYLQEEGVPEDSVTPTFAAAALRINNRRWDGVPFLIRAGKAMHARMTEMRIRFHHAPGSIFTSTAGNLQPNELVIRVQPDAGISFRVITKVPGLAIELAETDLNLQYKAAFQNEIPDAYESLLLDVLEGDKSLFIRNDELEAAWDIFTPVLHELEQTRLKPEAYAFGSSGPRAADALAARFGVNWETQQ